MGILDTIKRALSPQRFLAASASVMPGYGTNGSTAPAFDMRRAEALFVDWAYAAAMLNANAAASVPIRLYVRKQAGRGMAFETRAVQPHVKRMLLESACRSAKQKALQFNGEYEEVVEPHPALQVLNQVNQWQNGFEFAVLQYLDLQVYGNAYQHVIETGLGLPSELWRMQPRWTRVIPSETNYVAGYEYGREQAKKIVLPVDEVDHFKTPHPADPYYGRGWFEAAYTSLMLHHYKRVMDSAKFENMARPDYLITSKTPISNDNIARIQDQFNAKFKGSRNSGKFAVINADMDIKPLQVDVPEIGTPTRVIEEISAVSGVPVAMLLSNDPAKSASQTARVGWYRNTIRPLCQAREEKLNERYLTRFPDAENMMLVHDPVSFEDAEATAKLQIALVAGGVVTANEARSILGYQPMSDADVLYPPSGMTGGAAAVGGNMEPTQTGRPQGS